jgi:hypothetical protein
MANGYGSLTTAASHLNLKADHSRARATTAGVSSSASSSSSSSAPSLGSLVLRARLRRTCFPLLEPFWSWSSCSSAAAAAAVHLKVRGVDCPAQDRTGQDRLLLFGCNMLTETSKCLALNPYPLRLELLAHVGYVITSPSFYGLIPTTLPYQAREAIS